MGENKLYIPVILGTAREGRQSEKAAQWMLQQVKNAGIETELLDVQDFTLGRTARLGRETEDERAKKFSELMKRAAGLIIVAPVYNHGYPGELKIMLDMLYDEYNRKPVGICSVTNGGMGGPQMVEQLRLVAIEFQMVPIRNAVYFLNVGTLFDEQGNVTDVAYNDRAKVFLEELLWYAEALKKAREVSQSDTN